MFIRLSNLQVYPSFFLPVEISYFFLVSPMNDTAVVVPGYGKPWTFTVGLVGKPSAGAALEVSMIFHGKILQISKEMGAFYKLNIDLLDGGY